MIQISRISSVPSCCGKSAGFRGLGVIDPVCDIWNSATYNADACDKLIDKRDTDNSLYWAIILNMIAAGATSWSQALAKKNDLITQGYNFPPLSTNSYNKQYQALKSVGLSDSQIDQILQPSGGGSLGSIPTWVWVALGGAGLYVVYTMAQKKGS